MKGSQVENIDDYIAGFPVDIRKKLESIRATIRRAAPKAEEAIKYGMPTFVLEGNLVHFAAFKKHIGFYPAPQGLQEFRKELAAYEGTKGAVRFPLDKPLPLGVISKIVRFRMKMNREKALMRAKKK